ncbi:hypothetical protein [Novosphingobium sp.]|uniref:hypothetical protein n=1 Tax=Novosphingobium sp. TaxID=1874826 RepID=UPI0033428DF0
MHRASSAVFVGDGFYQAWLDCFTWPLVVGAVEYWYALQMGKRSGVPHRDDELAKLSQEQLEAELERSRVRLRIASSAKSARLWLKRIHWLEASLALRE